MEKKCSKCQTVKDISHFSLNKWLHDQKNNICKECAKSNLTLYHARIKAINTLRLSNNTLNQPTLNKQCRACKAILPLTDNNFHFSCYKSDGFDSLCIPCTKIRQKQPDRIYNFIKAQAKQKNRLFTITKEQHAELAKKPCFYCQENSDGWLDRKDSKLHYTLDNIVPSCSICNKMKRAQNSDDFINLCKKIASKH